MKYLKLPFLSLVIVFSFLFFLVASGEDEKNEEEDKQDSKNQVSTVEETKKCLVGADWVYPNGNNPTGALKFSSDGTFNQSTTMFGGMTSWGNWKISEPGKIQVTYTRSTESMLPENKTLSMSSCLSLKVGSTIYTKD